MEQRISIERMEQAVNIFGSFDENIRLLEKEFNVTVTNRDGELRISGEAEDVMHAAKAVHVAEGGIVQPAGRELRGRHGVIRRGGVSHLRVHAQNIQHPRLLRHGKAPQQSGAAAVGERRTPDAHAQLRQRHRLDARRAEDMYVLRKRQARIRRARAVIVVVAGREKHLRPTAVKRLGERLCRLGIGARAVEQVAREQDDLCPVRLRQLRQGAQQVALLPAALRRLRERERLKRRVEVQIRRVQDAHAHLRRTRCTSRQRPVSLSTSKIAPSSLAAPMAAS